MGTRIGAFPIGGSIQAMRFPASLVIAASLLNLACAAPAPRVSFEETLTLMSSVRGLHARHPIHHHDLLRSEMVEKYSAGVKESWESDEGWRYEKALVALGIWPPDRDMFRDLVRGLDWALDGFYDSESHSIYTPRDPKKAGEWSLYDLILGRDVTHQFTLAHEILHALQHDSYPELYDRELQMGQEDLAMALSAATEGDATYFACAVLEGLPLSGVGELSDEQLLLIDAIGSVPGLPVWIGHTGSFPYIFGYGLARKEGKHLLERPPISTEQLLHPNKRREPFLAMDLGAFESMLPDGCRSITENTLGELGILVLFRELGPAIPAPVWLQVAPDYFREVERFGLAPRDLADTIPNTIWEGWDGDRYVVAECEGDLEFVWITAWDSDADAREFEAGYRVIATELATRNGRSAPPQLRLEGRRVVVTTERLAGIATSLDSRVRQARISDLDDYRLHLMGRVPSEHSGTAVDPP
jgi:hypothetical protein